MIAYDAPAASMGRSGLNGSITCPRSVKGSVPERSSMYGKSTETAQGCAAKQKTDTEADEAGRDMASAYLERG
ncbi:hypothetical protein BRPE64_ACDS24430 [Caballeronia insecticola]|uniref:Uncharacterized protein n=1 Tax=Caballeronia insecticola TaxID=758793 RepID=R4X030_9BURK|nr:hypothetical protein BRPE64_ACDS24430 [Caballeronia insecticola]